MRKVMKAVAALMLMLAVVCSACTKDPENGGSNNGNGSGMGNAPEGAIAGKFTVSVSGNKVYFSQGNLQYQASSNTWRFAENQYDYVGNTNGNISSSYNGWIDLFGWGTSGWNNCRPWDSDSDDSNANLYGPPGQYNLTDSYANFDWGVYNVISNGGDQAGQWRTLTKDEWAYVFNTRQTESGIRYAKATVNGVYGVILFPDDWNTSYYSLDLSYNNINSSSWTNLLEAHGCVFLPAAGWREGISLCDVGIYGFYWSASWFSSSGAYCVIFCDSYLDIGGASSRCCGQSVRLVRSAQ